VVEGAGVSKYNMKAVASVHVCPGVSCAPVYAVYAISSLDTEPSLRQRLLNTRLRHNCLFAVYACEPTRRLRCIQRTQCLRVARSPSSSPLPPFRQAHSRSARSTCPRSAGRSTCSTTRSSLSTAPRRLWWLWTCGTSTGALRPRRAWLRLRCRCSASSRPPEPPAPPSSGRRPMSPPFIPTAKHGATRWHCQRRWCRPAVHLPRRRSR
jgi:hypothetical protein